MKTIFLKWLLSRLLETKNTISDAEYDKAWNASHISMTPLFTKIHGGNISVGYRCSMTFCWIFYNSKIQFISRSLFYSNDLNLITAWISNPLIIERRIQHYFYHINLAYRYAMHAVHKYDINAWTFAYKLFIGEYVETPGNHFLKLPDNDKYEQLSAILLSKI